MFPLQKRNKNQIKLLLAIGTYYVVVGQFSPVIVKTDVQNFLGYLTLLLMAVAVWTSARLMIDLIKNIRLNSP